MHQFLWYWNSFWVGILVIYMGIGLVDAFKGGNSFSKNWYVIIFICFPLFLIGSWAINRNKKKGG